MLLDLNPSLENVKDDLLPNVVSIYSFGGCIIPSSILGVNASGKQVEASLDFVRFALKGEATTDTIIKLYFYVLSI